MSESSVSARWLAPLGIVLFAAGTARAAEPTAHVTWSGSVRYGDNLLGAPAPGPGVPENAPRPLSDVGVQWSPGVLLRYVGPRARWILGYVHPMLLYVRHPLAHQSGDALAFTGTFFASPRDTVDVDVTLQRSSSTLTSLVEPVAEREIGPVRSAAAELIRAVAAVRHRHDLSHRWSASAELRSDLAVPLDDGAGLVSNGLSAAARATHERHAFETALTALHARILAGSRADTERRSSDLLLAGSELRWSWDATDHLSAQASAGATTVPLGLGGVPTRPVASASIGYDRDAYAATLDWRHAFTPSALTGQLTYGDTLALRGRVPLVPTFRLEAASGSGVAWTRVLDEFRGLDTGLVTTVVLDVALEWAPDRLPRVTLGYQYTHQTSPNPGQLLLPSFDRSVVALGAEYVFPPPTGTVVRRMRRRVDGRDRLGAEE